MFLLDWRHVQEGWTYSHISLISLSTAFKSNQECATGNVGGIYGNKGEILKWLNANVLSLFCLDRF